MEKHTWDYNDPLRHTMTQKDWNETLLTEILNVAKTNNISENIIYVPFKYTSIFDDFPSYKDDAVETMVVECIDSKNNYLLIGDIPLYILNYNNPWFD